MTGGVRPGDQRFDTITGRRPLIEAALARMLDGQARGHRPSRRGRAGSCVTADAKGATGRPLRVVGIVTDDG